MQHLLPWLLIVMVTGGHCTTAGAAVLATESFNYPASTGAGLNSLNGGTGWSAAWSDADNDVILASTNTSLSYPADSTLTSAGGRIELTSTDTSAVATRTLTTGMSLGTAGNEFYSSALINISSIGQTAIVQFQDSSTNIRWNYGINAGGFFTVGVAPESALQNAATTFTAEEGVTYLVVARIRTNTGSGGNDEVFLKVFDPSDSIMMPLDDNSWDAKANGNSGVTLVRTNLVLSNPVNESLQFDELRIGTTFIDVAGIPEPSHASLLALAVTGILFRRRRSS